MDISLVKVRIKDVDNLDELVKKFYPNFTLVEKDHEYYVIMNRNQFIGFFNIYKKEMFQKLFILPELRGKGIGKLVIGEIIKKFNNPWNKRKMYFYVKKSNKVALNLFKKYGFKECADLGNIIKMDCTSVIIP